MKEDIIDCYDNSETDNRTSGSKIFISSNAFAKQTRNMRRMHSNSILHQLRLSQKINQEHFLILQEKSLNRFKSTSKKSIHGIRSKKKMSDFNIVVRQSIHKKRLSQFCEQNSKTLTTPIHLPIFQPENKMEKMDKESDRIYKNTKEQKQFLIDIQRKKTQKRQKKPRNLILSSINNKIKQIDIISRTFDKVNSYFSIETDTDQQNYKKKCEQTQQLLKDLQSKLQLRKNKINERPSFLKKNTKIDYHYKVLPKRYQTQCSDQDNKEVKNKVQGLWNQNAMKMKNYITGGYTDEKQDYSDFCDIEEYRRLKCNFKTFQQIYNSIKDDKENPIGKVCKNDFKKPNILEVVSVMEKQHQLLTSKLF